jgi:hypothetical protein
MNSVGPIEPVLRVVPAHQRFHAAQAVAHAVDLGLVVQLELLELDRAAQVALQLQLLGGVGAHVGLEHHVVAAARALGLVHGRVGVGHELVGLALFRMQHDADRARDLQLLAHHVEGLGDRAQHAVGGLRAFGAVVHAFEQQQELVAADARHGVALARGLAQPVRGGAQDLVAGRVAEGIVDRLEAVEVDEEHRDALFHLQLVGPLHAQQRVAQPVFEQHAVGQAGQCIGEGAFLQLALAWVSSALASSSELESRRATCCSRDSSTEVKSVPSSSRPDASTTIAVRPEPFSSPELRQTASAGKPAAAMPV